jgi:hypothetical protein
MTYPKRKAICSSSVKRHHIDIPTTDSAQGAISLKEAKHLSQVPHPARTKTNLLIAFVHSNTRVIAQSYTEKTVLNLR